MLEEQPLDSRIHNCSGFDCGTPELNDYLSRRPARDRRRRVTQVYVLIDTDEPKKIIGYYTLIAAQVDADQLTEQEQRRLPRYPIPCFRMGRFAVRAELQGRAFGKRLLGCAVDRCLRARQEIAAYALLVEAKSDDAKAFYEHFGFVAFADSPFSLNLSLGRGPS